MNVFRKFQLNSFKKGRIFSFPSSVWKFIIFLYCEFQLWNNVYFNVFFTFQTNPSNNKVVFMFLAKNNVNFRVCFIFFQNSSMFTRRSFFLDFITASYDSFPLRLYNRDREVQCSIFHIKFIIIILPSYNMHIIY